MTEPSPRRLGVVARERQEDGLLDQVRRAAEERGMEVSFERAIADYAPGSPAFDLEAEPVDMILSLGGDGTLLRAARNTDGAAAFDLSNLANISADSAGGRGDH